MKGCRDIFIIIAFLAVSVSAQSGGMFSITKSVIADGGGLSISGTFVLDGTIGQCIAGETSNGGLLVLQSGFWSAESVPAPSPTPTSTPTPTPAPTLTQTPTPAPTPTPSPTPSFVSISGHIGYRDGGPSVANVTMTLTSPSYPTQVTVTDSSGNYAFTGLPAGIDYTVTPAKNSGVNGIESFDAATIARFVVGLDFPTATQRIASDADGSGTPTSFDASLIARYVVGLPDYGIVTTWKFLPANRVYPMLSTNQTNQNSTAILVGETSGNWVSMGPLEAGDGIRTAPDAKMPEDIPQPSNVVTLSLPAVSALPGSKITVPVTVSDLSGCGVRAFDLDIEYDPSLLEPQAVPADAEGTLAAGMLITVNPADPGHLIISGFQTTELAGAGTLINLNFHVTGGPRQTAVLCFVDHTDPNGMFHPGARFNAGSPTAATTKGSVKIAGPGS